MCVVVVICVVVWLWPVAFHKPFVKTDKNIVTDTLMEDGVINDTSNDGMVACTMDAKMCPDGSYVGRQGPKCEFAPCPGN